MKQVRAIIVGIDFSESSEAALREAARLSSLYELPLHIVHVVQLLDKDMRFSKRDLARIEYIKEATRNLKKFVKNSITPVPSTEYYVFFGSPKIELVDFINKQHAGLLILGAYGTHPDSKHVGSTARECVRRTQDSVLLVRKTHHGQFKKIIICTDFSQSAQKAVNDAASLASMDHAQLHILHAHVIPWKNTSKNQETPSSLEKRQHAKDLLQETLQIIQNSFPELHASAEFCESSSASYSICQKVKEHASDLVIIGKKGHNYYQTPLLGTTTERLISEHPCSIMTIQPGPPTHS